ncbi:MAG: lysophospholipid acyltransferase family protein [Balneola sp.]
MRKNWLWYQMFRYLIVKCGLYLFYKRIIIEGKEYLPKNKPILFVPNHQNSFMDALLVVTHTKPFIYFLTRAQAFSSPLLGKFLRSLNMLPVYRVRDGLSSVTKNNAIFEECINYLKRNDAVLVFPEANHDLRRRIRPLSKGFTRIAFDAEVRENWEMGLHIIPVGVNYTEHRRSRNTVKVVFGSPILMKDFRELYEKDEREATNELKKQVSDGMKELVMHVPNLDHYPLCKIVLDDLEENEKKLIDPDLVNANVKKIEQQATPELFETARKVYELAEKQDFSIKTIRGRKKPILALILLLPLYLFSWLNNLIPYQVVRKIIASVIKDHAFDASIKFLIGVTLFPLFWMLVSLILWVSGTSSLFTFGYLVLSVFTAPLFKNANLLLREAKEKKSFSEFENSNPKEYQEFLKGIEILNEFRSKVL